MRKACFAGNELPVRIGIKVSLQLVVKCLSPQRNSDPAMVEARRVNVLPLAINHLVFVDFLAAAGENFDMILL